MRVLGRYLGNELTLGVAMILMALIAIAYFVTFASEMGHVGERDFTTTTAVFYVLLKMPRIVHEMLPVALLIGGMFAFGGLAASNELTIMRATGASVLGLLWKLRKMGYLLLLVAIINMEWVVPYAEKSAKVMKATALHQSIVEFSGEAFWLKDGDYFVRMDTVGNDGAVAGVEWMEIPEAGELSRFSYAERAHHKMGQWNMEKIRTTLLTGTEAQSEELEAMSHKSSISGDFVRLASRTPDDLSTLDLFYYSRFLERSGIDSNRYWHTFWERIAAPFTLLVMVILALPFSVTEGRSLTAGKRVVLGAMLGIGIYLVNRVLLNTGEIYHLNPVVTAFAVPLLALTLALWLIRKRGL
ncbi:MAG: LPS export ABC transporter permease LptG [Gammaproteobacteria bacterium]|jgi:lipopolysaccharide export system permease protein|nr:LPS export ABC transporter permease LptG [Gammaproteobacteria bacterium]MBT3490448.1 LPS export ABC transporter permease LptG [Gammaproteobacteria bacterium]MBT3717621.1 LPS export ABC transporter permease LptG [Gammaproteobacteria bacterium]MBT3845814.1 LPS export ABC transporter permease LptG [Gammaproteobacteria bacterium]MBT3893882.1 LPS export ABC transporter permease LptG [Gammaproteobacteria bacterium]